MRQKKKLGFVNEILIRREPPLSSYIKNGKKGKENSSMWLSTKKDKRIVIHCLVLRGTQLLASEKLKNYPALIIKSVL